MKTCLTLPQVFTFVHNFIGRDHSSLVGRQDAGVAGREEWLQHIPGRVSPGRGGGGGEADLKCLRAVSLLTTKEMGLRSPSMTNSYQGAGCGPFHAEQGRTRRVSGSGGPLMPCPLGVEFHGAQPTGKLFCFGYIS